MYVLRKYDSLTTGLGLYVCIYVCMYVLRKYDACMYVCMYICMYKCTHVAIRRSAHKYTMNHVSLSVSRISDTCPSVMYVLGAMWIFLSTHTSGRWGAWGESSAVPQSLNRNIVNWNPKNRLGRLYQTNICIHTCIHTYTYTQGNDRPERRNWIWWQYSWPLVSLC